MTILGSHRRRTHAAALLIFGLALVAGCSTARERHRHQARGSEKRVPRVALDPGVSPVPFRWLADDAVVVAAKTGTRRLAGFGNYVSRSAQKLSEARLSVWDDEAAWKLAAQGDPGDDEILSHKRAEYVKDLSPPDPVDRYLVFNRDGTVDYQRDFRSWPLTSTDAID